MQDDIEEKRCQAHRKDKQWRQVHATRGSECRIPELRGGDTKIGKIIRHPLYLAGRK